MRSRYYRYRFNLVQFSLCFVDDLCQILGMFSLNSIGCVNQSAVLLAFEKHNRQMYVRLMCLNLIQKDLK